MNDLREHWAEVHSLLQAALSEVRHELHPTTVERVTDFLENNELEVAARWLLSAMKDQKVTRFDAAFRDIKRAAFLMSVNLERS